MVYSLLGGVHTVNYCVVHCFCFSVGVFDELFWCLITWGL